MKATALNLLCILGLLAVCAHPALAIQFEQRADSASQLMEEIGVTDVPTGVLYDLVLPLSGIEDFDGTAGARVISLKNWRQVYHEMRRASLDRDLPSLTAVLRDADRTFAGGAVPISILDFKYNRIRPGALEGEAQAGGPAMLLERRVFAAAALKDHTYRGESLHFTLAPNWYHSNLPERPNRIDIDFDDGRGYRTLKAGASCNVSYASTGRKTVRLRAAFDDASTLNGAFFFDVLELATPSPHDTLFVTATIPYLGEYESGQAYLYYGIGHTSIVNPVIVIEGFDIDNTMNWEVLYQSLNQENMIEDLRALGFDAVVLDFTDATDYIQRNSFVAVELIEEINAMLPPGADIAVVGASMGGLIGRYTLCYMEQNAIDHNVRTFISFDGPQKGANIPLGIQYWVKFFSTQSADADTMLQALGRPAPRQMLVYHLTDPPGTTGEPDPLFGEFLSDVAALGDYPSNTRKVAVANGSGNMVNQGFAPADQIIFYEYSSLLVDIVGNVWAVPDSANHIILDGLLDLIWPLPDDQMVVYVEGTEPYDGAPGGTRSTMAQMDSLEAPYGDIVALYDRHCFIPTISALDLDTDDLFYDIAGDPDLFMHTPFDTVYFPAVNEEHVQITPESKTWFIDELERGTTAGVGNEEGGDVSLGIEASPNPFGRTTLVRYNLPAEADVWLSVFDATGRRIAGLANGSEAAGWHGVTWDGTDDLGRDVAPGTYFLRLRTGRGDAVARVVLLR